MPKIENVTKLRKLLLSNGYVPLACYDKESPPFKWSHLVVNDALIAGKEWARSHNRLGTALRADEICFVDIDAPDEQASNAVVAAFLSLFPAGKLLRRDTTAPGFKCGFLFRAHEDFSGTLRSLAFVNAEGEKHQIEIFAQTPKRYIGAFGPHKTDEHGGMLSEYVWPGDSPENVKLDDLPVMSEEIALSLIDTAEPIFAGLDLQLMQGSTRAREAALKTYYDLTDEMVFETDDYGDLTLDGLKKAVKGEGKGICCSASFWNPASKNRKSALAREDSRGRLLITDWHGNWSKHYEASEKPADEADAKDEFQDMEDGLRQQPKAVADKASKVPWLLANFVFCSSMTNAPILPLYALPGSKGCSVKNMILRMMPYCEPVQVGTKVRLVNPVQRWLEDPMRTHVEDKEMRPDQPSPLFDKEDGQWLNTYHPPVHDAEPEGTAVFLDFICHLIPDLKEREWFLDRLAHKFQFPAIPGPGTLFVSKEPGTGRMTLFSIMRQLFGGPYTRTIDPSQLTGEIGQAQYTDWLANSLIVTIDELISPNCIHMRDRQRVWERFKLLVDPGARSISVIRKGLANYDGLTFASVFAATNRHNALPMEGDDRRTAVLTGGRPLERDPKLKARLDAYRDGHGWTDAFMAAVALFLIARNVAMFDPYATPPMFKGKALMISAAISDVSELAEQVVLTLPGDHISRDAYLRRIRIAVEAHDHKAKMTMTMLEEARHVLDTRWIYLGTQKCRANGSKADIWARNERAAKKWKNTPWEGRPDLLSANADPMKELAEALQRAREKGLEVYSSAPDGEESE